MLNKSFILYLSFFLSNHFLLYTAQEAPYDLNSEFFKVSLETDTDLVELFLAEGADVDTKNHLDVPILCKAACSSTYGKDPEDLSDKKITDLLIRRGAQVNKTSSRAPIVVYAAKTGNSRNLQTLIDAGANVHAVYHTKIQTGIPVNMNGCYTCYPFIPKEETALGVAKKTNNQEMVKILEKAIKKSEPKE